MSADLNQARKLLAHRELQFLRATGIRSRGGKQWVKVRARKLQEARELVARLERKAHDQ